MVEINWTLLAQTDLQGIYDYIGLDSVRYAEITVNQIFSRVDALKNQPLIGRVVPEIRENSIREIITGNYRIVYRVINDARIDVLRVYHAARLLSIDHVLQSK